MNTCIKWFQAHPKAKQWAWFAALWCGGLFVALAAAYPIKLLIRFMG